MVTPKASLLGVTHSLPIVDSIRRGAELEIDENGFQFVVYSGPREDVKLERDFIADLLELVPPGCEEYLPEDEEEEEDVETWAGFSLPYTAVHYIDPHQAVEFINKWGVIGLMNSKRSIPALCPPQELALLLASRPINRQDADRCLSDGGKLKREYQKRLWGIVLGDQVPYPWIESELSNLAKCVRLVKNLLAGDSQGRERFSLTFANRQRILAGWDLAPFPIPDGKDPAKYRELNEAWTRLWGDGFTGVTIHDADRVLEEFANLMNKYMVPVSSTIVRTTEIIENIYREDMCFESALAVFLLDLLRNGGTPLECRECHRLFFPFRHRQDGKWCSPKCGAVVRNREKRKRDKVAKKIDIEVPTPSKKNKRKEDK
jgi:hypothetical protein